MDRFAVIVVAAGKGSRMGTAESKQYLPLSGKPVLVHTLEVFEGMDEVSEVLLVTGGSDVERCRELTKRYSIGKVKTIVAGGRERQHSVYKGLRSLPQETDWVLIHDGVRPFVAPGQVLACWRMALAAGAAVLAVPVKDTIKAADDAGRIRSTPERRSLWAVQTPQAFRLSAIIHAHEQAERDGFIGTDDAMLLERLGETVHVADGSYDNVKITTPDDLIWAEWRMAAKMDQTSERGDEGMIRVGQGFDVHQLVAGRKCIIGGVTIPYEQGLLGHSDADVLLHAISDAVLGALGQGDIGRHFPDTDPQYKGANSVELLEQVWQFAKRQGHRLGNLDATIIAQRPKMAPYIPEMVSVIARTLETSAAQVNVKATTTEMLGFTGRGEGIAAQAVVVLIQTP